MIRNPILPGFNPDPSIVRVGDDFYLATSTFAWQPGIRLFHSTDLATWRLVGHGLRPGLHDFRGLAADHGVWAPCLTFDATEGLFYLTYSVMHSTAADYFDLDNYLVTASEITGPWSPPIYLNSLGFDPSFLHDEDGRHWFVVLEWETRQGYQHPGAIVLQEYDPVARALLGEGARISRGSSDRGCLEAPHLYRRDGWYYLMTAEGGTGYDHAVMLARSRVITGPYQPAPSNPVITSSPVPHFARNVRDHLRPECFNPHAELQKAGHGCLVDTPDGEWYVAHLCARPIGPGHHSVLGRETAIQKVVWTPDGWLELADGGRLARASTPGLAGRDYADPVPTGRDLRDDFDAPELDRRLSSLRRPLDDSWASLTARPGRLALRGGHALTSRSETSLVATQLQDVDADATTRVQFEPWHFSQSAGLVIFYDDQNFAYLRVYHSDSLASIAVGIVLVRAGHKEELLLDRAAVTDGDLVLSAQLRSGSLQFSWRRPDQEAPRPIGPVLDATFMSDEATRGFTGTMVGLACVDAARRDVWAAFDYLELRHGSSADQVDRLS